MAHVRCKRDRKFLAFEFCGKLPWFQLFCSWNLHVIDDSFVGIWIPSQSQIKHWILLQMDLNPQIMTPINLEQIEKRKKSHCCSLLGPSTLAHPADSCCAVGRCLFLGMKLSRWRFRDVRCRRLPWSRGGSCLVPGFGSSGHCHECGGHGWGNSQWLRMVRNEGSTCVPQFIIK